MPTLTREEFWASPLGIIFKGLIIGVIAILLIRLVIMLFRSREKKTFGMPRGVPRAKSMSFPEEKRR